MGKVGNVAGHGGCDDQGAGATLFEVVADGLGAVEGAVQIGLDDLIPLVNGAVQDTGVGGAAGIRHEGVDLAKLLDHVCDELLDGGIGANVAFVGFALDLVGF